MNFREKVLNAVKKIPKGETRTYGEIAHKAGNSKAARAVGAILKTNFDPTIPCHRVIGKNGLLTGYNRGLAQKKKLLLQEGATINV